MDEQKLQEAVEFYEAFQKKKSRNAINDAIRAGRTETVEERKRQNPFYGKVCESLESGLKKAAEEQRAKKEREEHMLAEKQAEERHAKRAAVENSSGWLRAAIKNKRGY